MNERRVSQRIAVNQPAKLTTLGDAATRYEIRIVDAHSQGMRIELNDPIRINQAVKIEYDDTLLLGDVCYCGQTGEFWTAGIAIHEILAGLSGLRHLVEALQKDAQPSTKERVR